MDQFLKERKIKVKEKRIGMEKLALLLEGRNLSGIKKILKTKKVKYKTIDAIFKTPYWTRLESLEFHFKTQKDLEECMNILLRKNKFFQLNIYTIEKGYYKPYILPDLKHPYIQTTFLFQKLAHSIEFVPTKDKIEMRNFLESFELQDIDSKVKGKYIASTYYLNSEVMLNEDMGQFLINCIEENKDYHVISQVHNTRRSIIREEKLAPYNILFGFPHTTSFTDFKLEEYYIRYSDDYVIHFASNIDIIELYERKNDKMSVHPCKRFRRSDIELGILEQEILTAINNFMLQKDYKREKKMREY